MTTKSLVLKRTSALRPTGQWRDDDYAVLENGVVVGRIFKVPVAPQDRPWMWATSSVPRTATSRRAKRRWPPWPSHGGGSKDIHQGWALGWVGVMILCAPVGSLMADVPERRGEHFTSAV